MKVFFGTVVRNAPVRSGGELVSVDWSTKTICARTPVLPTNPALDHDPNPRGNSRGCRGIQLSAGRVVAATYHTLKVYDLALRHHADISHALMVGVHETCLADPDRIWVAATAIDAALLVDLKTGELVDQIWPRETPEFRRALDLAPMNIDKRADNRIRFLDGEQLKDPSHLHLNSVAHWDGRVLALFNTFGVIADLTHGSLLVHDPALKAAHNLLVTPQGMALVNDTLGRCVRFYDLRTGKPTRVIDLMSYPWVRSLERWARAANVAKWALQRLHVVHSSMARPLFVRGLDVAGDLLFVGLSPAAVVAVDLPTGMLAGAFRYSRNVHVCVHGLKVLA